MTFLELRRETISVEKAHFAVLRQKKADALVSCLEKTGFLDVVRHGQTVRATRVERREGKKPSAFWQVAFFPDRIEWEWTVSNQEHSLARKIHVGQSVLDLLVLVEPFYPVRLPDVRGFFLDVLEPSHADFLKTVSQWALQNDQQARCIKALEKEKKDWTAANVRLNDQLSELALENDRLKARLRPFEGISDLAVKAHLMNAVQTHGALRPLEAASQLNVPLVRVEAALSDLIQSGYLEPVS